MSDLKKQTEIASDGGASKLVDSMSRQYRLVLAALLVVLGLLLIVWQGTNSLTALGMLVLLGALVWTGHTGWAFTFSGFVVAQRCMGKRYFEASNLQAYDLVVVIGLLLFLSIGFRYCEMVKYAFAFNVDSGFKKNWRFDSRQAQLFLRTIFRPQWYLGPLALLLTLFPADDSYLHDYWLQEKPGRWIILSFVLFFVWFVSRMLLSVVNWFKLKPDVADVAIRSHFAKEMWHDWAGVERNRVKDKIRNR
jgi:hypothetical protein